VPPLITAGLIPVQFQTIHPFLDGNGCIGRLFVTLHLWDRGVLRTPLRDLSLFLKEHRTGSHRLLQAMRERGDWEAWLDLFLTGVAGTASRAFDAATRIIDLFKAGSDPQDTELTTWPSAMHVL
jgi:Fic family protein